MTYTALAVVGVLLALALDRWGLRTRVTGPGLLASAEPSWIDHRRLAAPAFHHQRLEAVGEQVRAAARSAVGVRLPAAVGAGGGTGVVDVAALTHTIGLDAVGRALFSADLSGQAQTLLDATSDAAELVVRLGRAILPRAHWTPTRLNVRLRSARRRLDAASASTRRGGGSSGRAGPPGRRPRSWPRAGRGRGPTGRC